jgi:hypothetical protein
MLDESRCDLVQPSLDATANWLVSLYNVEFGGRPRGRFRIAMKHLRHALGRRRVYPEDMTALGRALYERGYVLVDMETFVVVINQKTFAGYRRVNEACLP